MLAPWKKNYDKPRQCPKKRRHHFADRGLSSQRHGFSGSRVWMWQLDRKEGWLLSRFSPVQFFVTLRTAAWQAPPSMRFSRQEYWNGLPRPPPEDLPDSGSSLCLLNWEAASLSLVPPRSPREAEHQRAMLLKCGAGAEPWQYLALQGDQTSQF